VGLTAGLDVSEKSVLPLPGFEPRIVHDKKRNISTYFKHLYFRAPNLLSAYQFQIDLRVPDRELESAGSGHGALACSFANLCMSALSTKFNRISVVNLRYYRFGQAVMTLLREGAVLCSDAVLRQACITSMVFEI